MSSVISTAVAGVAPAPKKVPIASENSANDGGAGAVPNDESASAASAAASYNHQSITTYDARANVRVRQVQQEAQKRLIDLVS